MTDPILTPPDPTETPIPPQTEATFSSGVSSVFQATAPLNDLAKESISVGQNFVGEVNQFGHNIVENVGEIMAEPGKLFQPAKTVSTLGNIVGASVESVKNLAADTVGLATGTVENIMKTGSDLANVRTEPKPDGGVMQPARPISELSNIWEKIIKSWTILATDTVSTGVNVAKKLLWAGENLLKKGLGVFKK